MYSTDLSVDDAAKAIIQAIDGGTEDVQKNGEDDSVAILTKSEYCLVYTSTDQTTMVQIAPRLCISGAPTRLTMRPAIPILITAILLFQGFFGDRDRYRQRTSGYENYSGETVDTNPVDPYKKLFRQRPPEQHQFQALIRRRNQLRQIGEKRRKRQESKPAVCIRTKPKKKEKIMAELLQLWFIAFWARPYALWYICGGFGDSP